MKKSLLPFLFLFILLTAFTCENETLEGGFLVEDLDNTNNSVVGNWLLTAWNCQTALDLNNDGEESTNLLNEMNCYTNETVVFNSNNTGVFTSNSYADFSFEIEVGTTNSYIYTTDCIQETEVTNFTWVQTGNLVLITDQFGEISNWILNNNQLSFLIPDGFTAFSDDLTLIVNEDITFVYTKQ